MRRTRLMLIGLIACGSVVFLASWFIFRSESRSAEYHLKGLQQAHAARLPPRSALEALRPHRLKYMLGGRIPIKDLKEHEEALIRLGYFQDFTLSLRSKNLVRRFGLEVTKAMFQDTNWSYSITGTNVFVRAATVDIRRWEGIASNVNTRMLAEPHSNGNSKNIEEHNDGGDGSNEGAGNRFLIPAR